MWNVLQKVRDRYTPYDPLITVRISKDALLHNLDTFRRLAPQCLCAPVLKSNAYGHGLLEVARVLEGQDGIAFLVVDSYFEVRVLRTAGIGAPLLVIGHTPTETILQCPFHDVSFTVAVLSQLAALANSISPHGLIRANKTMRRGAIGARVPSIHIKIDTGMHRQGIQLHELDGAIAIVEKSGLRVEGLCSHFADSDAGDPAFTQTQIERWNDAVKRWKKIFPQTHWYHLANTSGIRYVKEIDANVFRLGLGLYGYEGSGDVKNLRPALSMFTKITALRQVAAGEPVGYNCTSTSARPTTIATIPVGYFEGVDRRLSNKGFVRIRGKECPIVGRVSMNMTMVDVTDLPDAREGDEVEVIGTDLATNNTIRAIAEMCGTITHDILVHIPTHLKRVIA